MIKLNEIVFANQFNQNLCSSMNASNTWLNFIYSRNSSNCIYQGFLIWNIIIFPFYWNLIIQIGLFAFARFRVLQPSPTGERGGQPCRRHATAPSGRASPTPNTPSMEAQAHASCNRHAECFVHATAPPLAPPPRLLDCGTNTATRGDPARDAAAPAWRGGQCGQKWADSNDGGRRAGAAVTSSAKLTSHPGAAREPSLTAW
jgi:hypothetical protein